MACNCQADDPDDHQLDVDKLEALAGSRKKEKENNKFCWREFVLGEMAYHCQTDDL